MKLKAKKNLYKKAKKKTKIKKDRNKKTKHIRNCNWMTKLKKQNFYKMNKNEIKN
jgi:hypothetical protein